jgi:predicted amidohydrolase
VFKFPELFLLGCSCEDDGPFMEIPSSDEVLSLPREAVEDEGFKGDGTGGTKDDFRLMVGGRSGIVGTDGGIGRGGAREGTGEALGDSNEASFRSVEKSLSSSRLEVDLPNCCADGPGMSIGLPMSLVLGAFCRGGIAP